MRSEAAFFMQDILTVLLAVVLVVSLAALVAATVFFVKKLMDGADCPHKRIAGPENDQRL